MRNLLFITLAIGLGVSASALALDCSKAITTPDINECAAIEQKKVEVRLNQAYQRVLKSLDYPDNQSEKPSETKKRLIEAQRLWVKFREADCEAIYLLHIGGTIRNIQYIGCMQARAKQRIKELNAFEP